MTIGKLTKTARSATKSIIRKISSMIKIEVKIKIKKRIKQKLKGLQNSAVEAIIRSIDPNTQNQDRKNTRNQDHERTERKRSLKRVLDPDRIHIIMRRRNGITKK